MIFPLRRATMGGRNSLQSSVSAAMLSWI